MSLVTRCPECSSAFRVLPAQLAARGGRVRCGKCAGIFNGVAHLVQDPPRPEADEPSPQIGLFDPRGWPSAGSGGAPVRRAEPGGAVADPAPQANPPAPVAPAIPDLPDPPPEAPAPMISTSTGVVILRYSLS